ncbi:MAG: DUF2461 domain-containing protein [Prevotellaceae bacterium]|nr:DUF2461 domain-containing protein [Candidatus Faecinaster equi]
MEILDYLSDIAVNNNREWFWENRDRYDCVRKQFEQIVETLINRISQFDPDIHNVIARDTIFRFYRDTRFSADKSPYKLNMGAFICKTGKKSPRGGYYIHLQPGKSMVCGGSWCPDAKLLYQLRLLVFDRIDEYRNIVESPKFSKLFTEIGFDFLKTMPKGFPKDFAYPQYLKCKGYTCTSYLKDSFFEKGKWMDDIIVRCKLLKPYLDFINETIDDYL